MSRLLGILAGGFALLIAVSIGSATAASMAVPGSRMGTQSIPVTGNQLRPPQCPALYGNSDKSQVRFASPNFTGSGSTPLLILGTAGNNTIQGGNGADCIVGGGGNDTLQGRQGGDIIIGGPGNDTARGGAGSDTCYADSFVNPNVCESQNPDIP
jgi:Ca2+-binding RTX toxin-like protein